MFDHSSEHRSWRLFGLGLAAGLLSGLVAWRRLKARRASFTLQPETGPGTALITGASSGIGAVFARHLAAGGYDLVLVARRRERLINLASELEQQYPIRVEVLVADLAQAAEVARVERRLAQLDSLSLLVNNAGFGTASDFKDSDPAKERAMMQLHLSTTIQLTRAALPGMVARQWGAIINVSSVAAFFPTPGSATYCASKSYLNTFSEALQGELAGTGVQVQALCPGFTRTEFHYTPEYKNVDWSRIPNFMWLSADRVVAESLAALGRNQVICIPGLRYRLAVNLLANPVILSRLQSIYFKLREWSGVRV